VSSKVSLDVEISSRIAKAAGVMAKLNERVWINDLLSEKTKLQVYRSCVLSTLLYGSELWPTYARQEKRLNRFHLCCLRRLLQIKWQDRVSNKPTCRASLHYSSKDYGGLVMFTVWNLIACQGKSSTGNCGRAPDAWADLSFALRMFASVICDTLNSIPIPGRSSRKTAPPGITV